MDSLVCVEDFEKLANKILNKNTLDYYNTGSDEEITLANNTQAFKQWLIRPRVLRDVSRRSLTRTVLGKEVGCPIGFSPTAVQKLAHPDGELGNAKVAEEFNTIFVPSILSSTSVEEMGAATNGRKWFQLYMCKKLPILVSLIERAERSGFEAIVLTVDSPYLGKRRNNWKDKFLAPDHIPSANFVGSPYDESANLKLVGGCLAATDLASSECDWVGLSLSWDNIDWVKSITRLPVILKGLLSSEDVDLAIERGVAGIYVSNHGGRQLDSAPATIDVLESIVKAVNGRCEVYLDGGIRLGSDVFKALALGANMVFVGRPFLWGLAAGGTEGARRVYEILRGELDLTLALSGFPDASKIDRNAVVRVGANFSQN